MVHTSPDSAWNTLLAPFFTKKRALQLDAWGKYPSDEVDAVLNPFVEWIDKVSPAAKDLYPTPWATQRQILRATLQTFLSRSFDMEFAGLFRDKSIEELDSLAKSFHYDECIQREGLNKVLTDHAHSAGVKAEIQNVTEKVGEVLGVQ